MIAVRPRTLIALPRRAWRKVKTIAPHKGKVRERDNGTGMFESFEKMLENQVQLMFRNIGR